MEDYQKKFVRLLADSGALFFEDGLKLKDERPTPYLVNIGNISNNAYFARELGNAYARMIYNEIEKGLEITTLFGPAYKGIPISTNTQRSLLDNYEINLGVVFDRKKEKTHGEGSKERNLFVGNFPKYAKIYIVDDVLTSAKTKLDILEKIVAYSEEHKREDISIVGLGVGLDRQQINLEERNSVEEFTEKTGIIIDSIIGAREAIDFLHVSRRPLMIDGKMQKMSPNIYKNFQEYMNKYGVKQ